MNITIPNINYYYSYSSFVFVFFFIVVLLLFHCLAYCISAQNTLPQCIMELIIAYLSYPAILIASQKILWHILYYNAICVTLENEGKAEKRWVLLI